MFILHADHEQNCGTTAMRVVGSSHADPYSSAAAAASALYGPLHGGANEAVVRMLGEIGSIDNVPAFIESVKDGEGRLMGFGHRVYKNYDPRATIIKQTAYDVFEVTGKNPLLDIALALEDVALSDPYFVDRKLYPNVDFYSGLIYQALGFPVDMFTVLFAIPRTVGWLAHWQELLKDPEQKISRPRQWYAGVDERDYVAIDQPLIPTVGNDGRRGGLDPSTDPRPVRSDRKRRSGPRSTDLRTRNHTPTPLTSAQSGDVDHEGVQRRFPQICAPVDQTPTALTPAQSVGVNSEGVDQRRFRRTVVDQRPSRSAAAMRSSAPRRYRRARTASRRAGCRWSERRV